MEYEVGLCPSAKQEADCAAGGGIEQCQMHEGTVAVAAITAAAEAGKRNTAGEGRVAGLARKVGDEGCLCRRGASTHLTCSADHIIDCGECSLTPRGADESVARLRMRS